MLYYNQINTIQTIDTTQSDLKHFQDFLYRYFKNQSIMIKSIQFLTNQVDSLQLLKHTSLHHYDITVENLKLCPVIDLTGTYTYNTSKAVANYLQPLSKNQYIISDTLKFPDLLKNTDTNHNYKNVS